MRRLALLLAAVLLGASSACAQGIVGGGGVVGSGTSNNLAKFTASGTIGNASPTDNGTIVTLPTEPLSFTGIAAPALSAAGSGVLYFDSTANVFEISVNGGAFGQFGGPCGTSNALVKLGGCSLLTDDGTNVTLSSGQFLAHGGAGGITAIARTDAQIETNGTNGLITMFQTTTNGSTTTENAIGSFGYDSGGSIQKIGSLSSQWVNKTAGTRQGAWRFNAVNNAGDNIILKLYGEGSAKFFSDASSGPGAGAVALPNGDELAGETTTAGTYKHLISLDGSNIIRIGADATQIVQISSNLSIGTTGKILTYGNANPTDGQIFIGGTASGNWTSAVLSGTTNEVIVTNGNNSITLSTPQALGTTSSVGFGSVTFGTTHFANLPADANGSERYCDDCDPALPMAACASAGAKTGAFAFRVNGAWICGG